MVTLLTHDSPELHSVLPKPLTLVAMLAASALLWRILIGAVALLFG